MTDPLQPQAWIQNPDGNRCGPKCRLHQSRATIRRTPYLPSHNHTNLMSPVTTTDIAIYLLPLINRLPLSGHASFVACGAAFLPSTSSDKSLDHTHSHASLYSKW